MQDSACDNDLNNPSCFGSSLSCENSGCTADVVTPDPDEDNNTPDPIEYKFCGQAPDNADGFRSTCEGYFNNEQIWTSLGPISFANPASLIDSIMTFLLGVSGGFGMILILFGAFRVATSRGNPEDLTAGKDMINAAIMGILFTILSVLILQFIGVDLLNIPGLFN